MSQNSTRFAEQISDIRCIQLMDTFRTEASYNPHAGKWNVLGHYDYLDIVAIDSHGLLSSIRNHAQTISTSLDGWRKKHAIYALTYTNKAHIDSFWRASDQYPLIMVSIVHAFHEDAQITDIHQQIEQHLCNLQSTEIKALAYLSIDCSDIVIFWLSNSFSTIMKNVQHICNKASLKIHDILTICGYNKKIIQHWKDPGNNVLLTRWIAHEPTLDSVQIYLRSPSIATSQSVASKLRSKLSSYSNQKAPFLLAGQEDVFVHLQNLPVVDFIELYAPGGVLDMQYLVKARITSRATIGCINSSTLANGKPQRYTVRSYAQKVFKKLRTLNSKKNISKQSWYAPLCELLNELCGAEISSATYDIYVQEILCHKVLVDYIMYLSRLNDARVERFPNADLIHKYLTGWNQLSFHAMHSEWQITQPSINMNRLYLYPAKLGMLYSAVLFTTATMLSHIDSNKDTGVFFLSPTLTSHPIFMPVYKNKDYHVKLVLGHIPPDMMFAPDMLIPILVHETAHYIGRNVRCRKVRLNSVWNTLLFFFLLQKFFDSADLKMTDKNLSVDELYAALLCVVEENYISIEEEQVGFNFVSEVTFPSVFWNLNKLFQQPYELVDMLYRAIITSSNATLTDINALFLLNNPKLRQPIFPLFENEVKREFDVLIRVYSESFSDLCMIRILNLSAEDYILLIVAMYGIENLNNSFSTNIDYSRLYSTIHVCFGASVFGELFAVLDERYMREKTTENYVACSIANHLLKLSRLDSVENIKSRYEYYMINEHIKYLEACNSKLQDIILLPQVDMLRKIYSSLSSNPKESVINVIEIYSMCEQFIKKCHLQLWEILKHS